MATTIENILGGTRQAAPPPAAPDKEKLKISEKEKKGVSPAQAMPTTKQTEPPQHPKRMSYEDMFKKLNPYQPPTEQELEKERKKQRREQIFAAIGDGISALSNLFFTTQYAPNMYSGRNTASQRTKERWDRLAAERNANMTAYINGLMRARQADEEYNANERAWERQLGLDKIKQARDAAADARPAAAKPDGTAPKARKRRTAATPSESVSEPRVGDPCPACGRGVIIKGKTAYGCSEWRNGCNWRKPFGE